VAAGRCTSYRKRSLRAALYTVSCCCTYRIQGMRASVHHWTVLSQRTFPTCCSQSPFQRQTNLRSATNSELFVFELVNEWTSFQFSSAPRLWNDLPTDIKRAEPHEHFERNSRPLFSFQCWFTVFYHHFQCTLRVNSSSCKLYCID